MPEFGKLDDLMPAMLAEFQRGKMVRLYPRGSSMLPMLAGDRDSVMLSAKSLALKKYDVALYRRPDGQYVLHRVVRVHADGYDFCGDNQLYVEKGVQSEWIIAKVLSFTRAGKLFTVTDLRYRAYCRGIVISRPLRLFLRRVKNKLRAIIQDID